MTIEGTCLCGAVKIKVDEDPNEQVLCHCTDCAQTSGAAFSTNILPKDSALHVSGPVNTYVSKAASGRDVTRTFCSVCGSSISHKSPAFGDCTAVQTGNLYQHFKNVKVVAELFTKDRWAAFEPISGAGQKEAM